MKLKNIKIFAFLLTLSLFSVVLYAQSIRLSDFSGGLYTDPPLFQMGLNDAAVCTNWDLSHGLVKRNGYVSIYSHDSTMKAIYAYYGSQFNRLLGVYERPSTDALYGVGVLSNSYGFQYNIRMTGSWPVHRYIYTGVTPYFTTWKDKVIVSNGRQRPIIYFEGGLNRYYARELVVPAPGEPFTMPIADSGNYLNGTYRYAVLSRGYCGESYGGNELANGDLETWTDTVTAGSWDGKDTTFGRIFSDNTNELNGDWCARFEANSYPAFSGASYLVDTIALTGDSVYRYSAYFKTKNTGTDYQGYIVVKNTSGDWILEKRLSLTTSYARLQEYFTCPSNDTAIALVGVYCPNKFGCDSEDTVYIDSVSIDNYAEVDYYESYISQPIYAEWEKILLKGFSFVTGSSSCADPNDSLTLYVYRTKANPGVITPTDKFYNVATYDVTESELDALEVIDSLPDTDLDSLAVHYPDTTTLGRDTLEDLTGIRVGAPTYIARNVDTAGSVDETDIFGLPLLETTFPISMSYICTYYDTLIPAESDSGRSLTIWVDTLVDADSADHNYTIGLPKFPNTGYLEGRLYRSYTYDAERPKDSVTDYIAEVSFFVNYNPSGSEIISAAKQWRAARDSINKFKARDQFIDCDPDLVPFGSSDLSGEVEHIVKYYEIDDHPNADSTVHDTIITPYYLIHEFGEGDTVYVDMIPYDSMIDGEIYYHSAAPVRLNGITAFGDNLWGWDGSRAYWSKLDSAGFWGSFRNIALNLDDGDEITAIVPYRDHMRVYKNKSIYVLYPDDNYDFARQWLTEGIGCIASRSMAKYVNSLIYLSGKGVIYEGGASNLKYDANFGVISGKINNLILDRKASQKAEAVGFIYDDRYLLTFPGTDTTFVCFLDLPSKPWSIWTFDFTQATMYDTFHTAPHIPSGDMLFINGDDGKFYKMDTTHLDNSASIVAQWRSAPVGITSDLFQISGLGLWSRTNASGIDVRFYDEDGDSTTYLFMEGNRYDRYGLTTTGSGYFQIDIQDSTTAGDSLLIDAIDIWTGQPYSRQRK